MINSISNQSWLFLSTVAIGFFTGFIYDIFRIMRKTFKHPDILTQIEDLTFWLLVSGVVFYFLLNKNYGEIRIYSLIGVFTGMILYFMAISRFVILVSVTVINFFKKVLLTLVHIITFPIKLVLKILFIPLRFVAKQMNEAKKPVRKALQSSARYAKIKSGKVTKELKIIFKKV